MNRETRCHPATGRFVCGRSRRPPDGLLRPAIRAAGRGNSIARCDTHVYPLGSATDGGVDHPDVGADRDEHAAAGDDAPPNTHAGPVLRGSGRGDDLRAVDADQHATGQTDSHTDPADRRLRDAGCGWSLPAILLADCDARNGG